MAGVVVDGEASPAPEPLHWLRFGVLLAAVIGAFAIQGIATPGPWGQILVVALLGSTLLLALSVGVGRPRVMHVAYVFVAAAIALTVLEAANGNIDARVPRLVNGVLVGLAPPAIVMGVIRSMRERGSVTVEAVLGVLTVYILIGMFFASLYGVLNTLGGGAFFAANEPATVARCIYFSFATLTTVGFGDITARTNLGHTLAVSEALLGQIYLVTVVALIVGNLGRVTRPGGSP